MESATYGLGNINNESSILLGGGKLAGLLGDERPELLDVDGGAVVSVSLEMHLPHTTLAVVTRVVFVHVDSLVMHTTSETATTGRFSMLADSAVTHGSVTSLMSRFSKSKCLYGKKLQGQYLYLKKTSNDNPGPIPRVLMLSVGSMSDARLAV